MQWLTPAEQANGAIDAHALSALAAGARERGVPGHELVIYTLRDAIQEGILGPGERLRQEELAAIFKTSRIPVRDALLVLQHEGLVESGPHRGFVVTSLDVDQLEEIYELRSALEAHAVRQAIPVLTDEDLAELTILFDEMEGATDPAVRLSRREQFYLRLYAVAARPQLLDLIIKLRKKIPRRLRWGLVQHQHEPDHRRAFFEAVRGGHTDAAVAELESHYRRLIALLRRYVRAVKARPP